MRSSAAGVIRCWSLGAVILAACVAGCNGGLVSGGRVPRDGEDAGVAPPEDGGAPAADDSGSTMPVDDDAGAMEPEPPDAGPSEPPDAGATPPPPAGEPPNMRHVVDELAAERPDLLAASCVADGGNNEFLFEAVRRLRRMDARWGLNWKRGVVGDMSQDVVDYYFGEGEPVEGSTDVFIIDIIVSICSPDAGPGWTDVTEATRVGGTIGRWTLAGRTDL